MSVLMVSRPRRLPRLVASLGVALILPGCIGVADAILFPCDPSSDPNCPDPSDPEPDENPFEPPDPCLDTFECSYDEEDPEICDWTIDVAGCVPPEEQGAAACSSNARRHEGDSTGDLIIFDGTYNISQIAGLWTMDGTVWAYGDPLSFDFGSSATSGLTVSGDTLDTAEMTTISSITNDDDDTDLWQFDFTFTDEPLVGSQAEVPGEVTLRARVGGARSNVLCLSEG